MLTLYNVISQDGFIARENGDEDFIPDALWTDFLDLCQKNDAVIISRKTYEAIQEYPRNLIESFENLATKRVVVTEKSDLVLSPKYLIAHSPAEAMTAGQNLLLSSGAILNQAFLENNLVDQVILNVLATKIGAGIRAFTTQPKLSLITEENFADGRKRCVYRVEK
ncbi:MAG: dihydrofolate reductase family protein [Patescibacteria group bacterium]